MKRVLPYLLVVLGAFASFSDCFGQIPGMPNRWNSVAMPNLDTGLVGASSFTIGSKTYVISGDTSEFFAVTAKLSKAVWVYNNTTRTWSRGKDFPGDPRIGAVAFGSTSTGKGYFGLGFDSTDYRDTAYRNNFADTIPFRRLRFFRDWWEYDQSTDTWTKKKDFPNIAPIVDVATAGFPKPWIENGVANASSFVIDTTVTILGSITRNFAGGFIFGEYLEMTWDSTLGFPTPPGYGDTRWDGFTATRFNNRTFFYHAAQDSFYFGPLFPGTARSQGVAMILDASLTIPGKNPKLYAGLGNNGTYNLNLLNIHLKDWWSYNFLTNSWKIERNLPDTGKSNAGVFAYNHFGFVVCGFDGEWKKHHFLYNTDDEDWTRYPDYRDSGRSIGVGFSHGDTGFYGAGFRGNSEELKSFSLFRIDTNTIRVSTNFAAGATFCAGDSVTITWTSKINFPVGAVMTIQVSDKDGFFEWPISAASFMGTVPITAGNGVIKAKIPHKLIKGSEYRIRLISSVPNQYFSRLTPVFNVRENPKFTYYPKIHAFTDTVCLNADFFIPSEVTGDNTVSGGFTFSWLKNGAPNGQTRDTMFLTQTQFADAGIYRLVAIGDCYADTSMPYYIAVENIPPPIITTNLTYPGMVGRELFLCEFDTTTFRIVASAKKPSYIWLKNNKPILSGNNLEGLGGPSLYNRGWNLADSGIYKMRVQEACGAYTLSDSIIVRMRSIPRITEDPKNLTAAALEGDTVGFRVRATGYLLNYQWRKEADFMSNDIRISGTQTDTLTIKNLIASDVAFYSCIVTGGCPGFMATSNLAILDINASPTIIKQPRDTLEMCVGTTNYISLVAQGTNMRYNWQYVTPPSNLDPTVFFGINARVLEVKNPAPSMSGLIFCEIDNSAGAVKFSTPTYLKVNPAPTKPIVSQVGSQLTVDLNCQTYLWFMNGVWKGQYNSRTIQPQEEGDYTVRVLCNNCPSEMSDPTYTLAGLVRSDLDYLEMYPNPASNKVVIQLPGVSAESPATLRLFDISGKLIKTILNVESDLLEIELAGLSKGMYVVHVNSSEVNFSGKLIKE